MTTHYYLERHLFGPGQRGLGAGQQGPLEARQRAAAGARRGQLRRREGGHGVVDGVDPRHELLLVGRLKQRSEIAVTSNH